MANRDYHTNRDITGRPMPDQMGNARLARLGDLDDYEVADGEPDVRGWDVTTADGHKIGEVKDLIVDLDALEVRYLTVDLKEEAAGGRDDRRVLVPLSAAQLDDDDDKVRVQRLPRSGLAGAPAYRDGPITEEDRRRIREYFGNTREDTSEDTARFFGRRRAGRDRDRFIVRSEEELAIGRRPVQEGEVAVRKHVETEHVREEVPVRHEDVSVERRPARPGVSAQSELREDEIRVPVMGEELVVEKRVVPKEEVVIKRDVATDKKTVEADLRRERVDVDRSPRSDEERRT